jgi:hypothetical protein
VEHEPTRGVLDAGDALQRATKQVPLGRSHVRVSLRFRHVVADGGSDRLHLAATQITVTVWTDEAPVSGFLTTDRRPPGSA